MKIQQSDRTVELLFYVRELSHGIELSRVKGFRVGKANAVDYLLGMLPGQPRLSLMPTLVRGDRYFTIRQGLRIAAVGRICYANTPEVVLEKGEAALISLYTRPEYRGRGFYPRLLMEQLQYLTSHGYIRACIWVDRANEASIRGIEKAGFTQLMNRTTASC